jgi:hypothetical protein
LKYLIRHNETDSEQFKNSYKFYFNDTPINNL